jgi:nifR3 family TIM-barrel protein
VTVKTRSGWSEETRRPVDIARRMEDAGARAFTLHARTRTQMFSGDANWDEIAAVVEALEIPVIGNGDVETGEDVKRMVDHTGCAAVMIGRGSFGNPWIFRDGRARLAGEVPPPPPDAAERFRLALEHAYLALELQGDRRETVLEFRKHLGWYTKGLPNASALRAELFQVDSMAQAAAIFEAYLDRARVAV